MSTMKKDEMSILKSIMIRLDENDTDPVLMLVAHRYHTERGDNGKIDKAKSEYQFIMKAMKQSDWQKVIDLAHGQTMLEQFTWENDKWHLFVNKDSTNYAVGRWIYNKSQKQVDWDTGLKCLGGWKKATAKKVENVSIKDAYLTDEYVTPSGEKISITNKEAVLKHLNELCIRPIIMKSKLPKFVIQPVAQAASK